MIVVESHMVSSFVRRSRTCFICSLRVRDAHIRHSAWEFIFFPSKSKYCMNTEITEGISLPVKSSISRQML